MNDNNITKRVTVNAMEKILGQEFSVLDKGFVRVIDYMGDDNAIVQAARISYGQGTKHVNQDKALIRYLMRNRHTSPFEMCEIKLHFKLPLFVAQQWLRHRTAHINAYSGRYSEMPDEFYYPNKDVLQMQSTSNKQGRDGKLSESIKDEILQNMQNDSEMCYETYQKFLNLGVTRELARNNLTFNIYTSWYWKIDVHNLLHFLRLRCDSHAQYEIRQYANQIKEILKIWMPITYEAFCDYCQNGVYLSHEALKVVKAKLNNEKYEPDTTKLGKRELQELMEILNIN